MANVTIDEATSLKDGESWKFGFERDGVLFEAFIVRAGGRLFAYENRCKHLPLPLDYGDAQFFTPDREHLVCSSHGALYDPTTGKCVQGPCAGASLTPLEIDDSGGTIVVVIKDLL